MIHDVLDNGVEIVLKENHFTPTVAIQAWVSVGSLHEGPAQRGMAHFLEHMLFKGTQKRAVGEIAASVESCGGDINAYTTFDHTVFHLTLGAQHGALGLDLLCDAIANSALDPEEFAREREVILEEIRRSNDSPGARVGRRVFELMFAGSEAGRPIIGSEASVQSFTRDELYAFYRQWYTPSHLTVVVVGDFAKTAMLEQVRATFGCLPAASSVAGAPLALPRRPVAPADWPQVAIVRGDFQQVRLEVVYPAPPQGEVDSTALDLAAFALGSGEMSRLNRTLRDEEGCVSSIGASVYAPHFGGLFELSALTQLDDMLPAVHGIAREVTRLRGSEPVSEGELARARANLKAERLYQEETVDGQARNLGFGMRTPHKLLYDDVYTAMVNHMPEAAIEGAVARWLKPTEALIVALVPDGTPLREEQLRQAFREGVAAGTSPLPDAAKFAVGGRGRAQREASVSELKPGLKVVYRHNPNVELFTLTAATEGGLRGEGQDTAGLYNALFAMLGLASAQHPYSELMSTVEGLGASLEGFSGKDSAGFHLQCLTEQAPLMLELFRDAFLHPVLPDIQWSSLRRELEQALKSQNDSPSGICVRRFQEQLYGAHPYRYSLLGTEASLAGMTPERLLAAYHDLMPRGPWVLAVASTKSEAEVHDLLKVTLSDFHPAARRRSFASSGLLGQGQPARLELRKDREQAHLVYGFNGLTWDDPDRAALDVLITILGGHGGRLFRELRDKHSLAYTVSPLVTYGVHPGIVGSYIACAPAKAERALAALEHEMLTLTHHLASASEVGRARSYLIGSHEMGLQKSDAQTSTMALMELYGYGYDDFLTYPASVSAVQAEDVQRVAQRLFQPAAAVAVSVGPESKSETLPVASLC